MLQTAPLAARMRGHRPISSSAGTIVGDFLKGAVAGAVSTLVIDGLSRLMQQRKSGVTPDRKQAANSTELAPAQLLEHKLARFVGKAICPERPHAAATATHFAFEVAPTAVYNVVRKRILHRQAGYSLPYGLGLSLIQAVSVNGLTAWFRSPTETSWQAHARGVAKQFAHNALAHATLDVLDRKKHA